MQALDKINSATVDCRDRIKEVIETLDISVADFSASIGVSKQSVYDIIGRRRNQPNVTTLSAIAESFKVDANWLLTGQGNMFKPADSLVANGSPNGSPNGSLNGSLTAGLVPNPAPVAEVLKSRKTKPLVSMAKGPNMAWQAKVRILPGVKASAGTGQITEAISENQTKEVLIPGLSPSRGGGYLALLADGDSMEPTIFDGDLMVIDQVLSPALELKVGQVYVVLTHNDDSYVKRLINYDITNLCFASDNQARKSVGFHISEIQKIYRVALKISGNLGQYTPPTTAELMEAYGERLSLVEARK
jgi:phage repressor protein C with HTH and peptisase S24 domain